MTEQRRTRVVYVAGAGRSGTTLLDRLLGQVPGVLSLGEFENVWLRGCIRNELCGCNQEFQSCAFWKEIFRRALPDRDIVAVANRMIELQASVARMRHVPLLASRAYGARFAGDLKEYAGVLHDTYDAIAGVSGATALVDSSKCPAYGLVLSRIAELAVHVVHLVRDSRAVAYSWTRAKRRPDVHWEPQYMPVISPTRSALSWTLTNAVTEFAGRFAQSYQRVRYEDLCDNPGKTTSTVLGRAGIGAVAADFLMHNIARLEVSHTVSGNPMRLDSGAIRVDRDVEWRDRMPTHQRSTVTALSYPMLVRHGYFHLFPGKQRT